MTSFSTLPAHHQRVVIVRLRRALRDNDRYAHLRRVSNDAETEMGDIETAAIEAAIAEGFADEETVNMTKGNNRVGGAPC